MITLIVFSRDRAQQLDLLLKSVERYALNIFKISIIYNYSNNDFKQGYEKLIKSGHNINWLYQPNKEDFRKLTLEQTNSGEEYICFSTDDEVIFRPIDSELLTNNLPKFDNHIFSLRLGKNTLVQDCHKENNFQPPLNIYTEKEGILTWPVSHYLNYHNYGYPFSLDLHIFRRNLLLDLLLQINFSNTNELEGNLTRFRDRCDYMSSFINSCCVNIPINNISNITQSGQKFAYSNEKLNQLYLDGYEIDLEHIIKNKFIGCHQECEFQFIKKQ